LAILAKCFSASPQ